MSTPLIVRRALGCPNLVNSPPNLEGELHGCALTVGVKGSGRGFTGEVSPCKVLSLNEDCQALRKLFPLPVIPPFEKG